MICHDLRCGGSSSSSAEGGPCSFRSCLADLHANYPDSDSDSDSEIDSITYSARASSVGSLDCIVDIDKGVDEVRISVESILESECRICMLSLDSSEPGIAIQLGCSCKDGLEAAHQHCAETWFRSKGNNICEICHSIAQNVVVPNNIESRQHVSQVNDVSTNAVSVPVHPVNTALLTSAQYPVPVNTVSTNVVLGRAAQVSTSTTNALLVPVSNVHAFPTTAVQVPPVSSTPPTQGSQCNSPLCFLLSLFIFMIFLGEIFNGILEKIR